MVRRARYNNDVRITVKNPLRDAPSGPSSHFFIPDASIGGMTDQIKIYQKPTCSKCRETLGILSECGVDFESINYYERPFTSDELKSVLEKLGVGPREIMRKDEKIYRELKLASRDLTNDELVELMVENPDLIQRPIVVRGDRAVLARPPKNVEELLEQ